MSELLEHLDEFRLLLRGGHLRKKEGWRNVLEHQAIQFYAIGTLADMLGLPKEEKDKVRKVALVHDWDKRMEVRPEDFTVEEKEKVKEYLERVKPDSTLMEATKPSFMQKALYKNPSFLEYLQYYVDNIVMNGEILSLDTRLADFEKRHEHLNKDPELTKSLGGRRYWDVEREVSKKTEGMIFERLKERGVEIEGPSQIPSLLKAKLSQRNASFASARGEG